jgi:hypothetical protein
MLLESQNSAVWEVLQTAIARKLLGNQIFQISGFYTLWLAANHGPDCPSLYNFGLDNRENTTSTSSPVCLHVYPPCHCEAMA